MSEQQAQAVASALGGAAWHSGGGIWLVLFTATDRMVVISEDAVCEYESRAAFDEGRESKTIILERSSASPV